jgi:hypothetical protein
LPNKGDRSIDEVQQRIKPQINELEVETAVCAATAAATNWTSLRPRSGVQFDGKLRMAKNNNVGSGNWIDSPVVEIF